LQCSGTYSGTYVNVTVPPNAYCNLDTATVLGNATVLTGGQLSLADSAPATIDGNVVASRNASYVQYTGGSVGGTITTQDASFLFVAGGTTHSIVANSTQYVEATSAVINGSVVVNQPTFANVSANQTITGDVIANGEPAGGSGLYIEDQVIGGSVYITNNQTPPPPPGQPAANQVFNNTIAHNLVCSGNTPPPTDNGNGNWVKGRQFGQCAGFANSPGDGVEGG
jgi:hypothetical protein